MKEKSGCLEAGMKQPSKGSKIVHSFNSYHLFISYSTSLEKKLVGQNNLLKTFEPVMPQKTVLKFSRSFSNLLNAFQSYFPLKSYELRKMIQVVRTHLNQQSLDQKATFLINLLIDANI